MLSCTLKFVRNSYGQNVFCSIETEDNIQISKNTFYYRRHSIHFGSTPRSMSCLGIKLPVNGQWQTKYTIDKTTKCSSTTTECALITLNCTETKCGIKLDYDQTDNLHADMWFSDFMISHSIYYKSDHVK